MLGQSLGGLRPSLGPARVYTPTVTQSGALASVGAGLFQQVGRMVDFWGRIAVNDFTGAVGANDVVISLPVAAASATLYYSAAGSIFDTSASVLYEGLPRIASATTFKLQTVHANSAGAGVSTAGNLFLGSIDFTAALGNGDVIDFWIRYEAAS